MFAHRYFADSYFAARYFARGGIIVDPGDDDVDITSSQTYAYVPTISEITDEAFERCGKDPSQLTNRHLVSARRSLNLMFGDWGNRGVHLFGVDEQTQTLTAGTCGYSVATGTLFMLDAVIRRNGVDTPVEKIAREQFHLIPDKTARGMPTQLYHDRATGRYFLWQAPENSTDVLRYYRMRRIQDVNSAAETPDVMYLWLEACAACLAAKLAVKFAPDRLAMLKEEAYGQDGRGGAFQRARVGDVEHTNTSFSMCF